MSDESRDDQVRRLLADARHDEPMPADVVARLDGVLAELAGEPARVRPVTDLATRRRRVSRMLLAAAAVVVVGVGVQQVVLQPQGESDSASADKALLEEEAPADSSGGQQDEANGVDGETFSSGAAESAPQSNARGLQKLTSDDFADDVTLTRSQALKSTAAYDAQAGSLDMAMLAAGTACQADAWGKGTFVPVLYDGTPAVLVFRRALGDTQVADLFLCGDTEPVRSVTLPAP